jgi:predicted helicase
MQGVLDVLQEHRLDKEADTLQKFYDSVKLRAEGIDNATGKQKIVVELYDKFFRNAFPKMTERLGIVYTPVEVVDFIIHSVNDMPAKRVRPDPGQQGRPHHRPLHRHRHLHHPPAAKRPDQTGRAAHKYKHEIHANEIVCWPTTSPPSTSRPSITASWRRSMCRSRASASPTPSRCMRRKTW